ncbi:hypothetical protein AB0J83_42365 [Actinoplanes sp. NPDC049596]|uniref:hypothetical protein n=1 Tax=unclassified Actinoplanes TaxID=2626549 RepID=UPI00341B9546
MAGDYQVQRAGLIAGEAGTKGYEGAGIIEAASALGDGVHNGDWFGVTANGAVTALGAVGAVMDPFQAVFAAGVGWLMEHLDCLREPLDWLCGDPKEIEGHANTWRNVEQRMYDSMTFYVDEVDKTVAYWSDQAAAAYRSQARGSAENLEAAGKLAGILSEITMLAGAMVGVVRNTVRDLIAEVVGAAISKALWALTVVAIPKVAAEISIMVTKYATKIAGLLKRLSAAVKELAGKAGHGTELLESISRYFAKQGDELYLGAQELDVARQGAGRQFGGTGWRGLDDAHAHVKDGHVGAHGSLPSQAGDILKTAPRDNALQNAGSYGAWTTDEDEPSLKLPL